MECAWKIMELNTVFKLTLRTELNAYTVIMDILSAQINAHANDALTIQIFRDADSVK